MIRIGLNTSQGAGGDPKIKSTYIRALRRIGCEPVPILPRSPIEELKSLQGIVLIGGPDVPAEFYGGRCHPTISAQSIEKVDHDFKILSYATKRKIPVLGICAGMQTLGCFFGGSLFQHIPDSGTEIDHKDPKLRHKIIVTDRLARILQTDQPWVNTRHHQCLYEPGSLRVEAYSPDGFIEAVSHRDYPILGVQWHPEDLVDETPFNNLFRRFRRGFRGVR